MTDLEQRPDSYWLNASETLKGTSGEEDGALPGEVEIALVEAQTTLSDVVSVRARPHGQGIAYRSVDEYEGEWRLPIEESSRPLTLGERLELLDGARLADD